MLKEPFMLPKPLSVYKGSYFEQVVRWTSDDLPVDIGDYDFQMMVRETYDSPDALIEIGTRDTGIIINDGPDGRFTFFLTTEQTERFPLSLKTTQSTQIPYKDFVFDIDAIPPDDTKRFQFMKGVLRVFGEVTRQ